MMIRAITVTALLCAAAFLARPQAKTDDDALMRAMRDELDRSRQLRIVGGGDETPYFVGEIRRINLVELRARP